MWYQKFKDQIYNEFLGRQTHFSLLLPTIRCRFTKHNLTSQSSSVSKHSPSFSLRVQYMFPTKMTKKKNGSCVLMLINLWGIAIVTYREWEVLISICPLTKQHKRFSNKSFPSLLTAVQISPVLPLSLSLSPEMRPSGLSSDYPREMPPGKSYHWFLGLLLKGFWWLCIYIYIPTNTLII